MTKGRTNFEGQVIHTGMDIHKSSWNPCIYLNDLFTKNVHQKNLWIWSSKVNESLLLNIACITSAIAKAAADFIKNRNYILNISISKNKPAGY